MVKLSSTEEENTEFLSSLWDSYKYLILMVIVLVAGGIIGWESWSQSKTNNLHGASDLYEDFINSVDNPDLDEKTIAQEIIQQYPSSLYADLVTFHIAKFHVDQNQLEEAKKNLEWILRRHSSKWGSDFNPIEVTARLRLARVLIANKNPSRALEIIDQSKDMSASLYEVKGDAEEQLGQFSKAKLSYLRAIESTQNPSIVALLKMKLADLGS